MFQNGTLVEIKELAVQFELLQGVVPAVNGVSFEIKTGQTLGVVGESGSGKSVTALSILGLVPSPPGRLVGGQILFHRASTGEVLDMTRLPPKGRTIRDIRGNEIAMIFQEPMTSLTPAYTIGEQIMEAIILHQAVDRPEARRRALDILERVGMPQPSRVINSYPHQLSGGMMQRAMIAIALSCRPSLLIADEPTTALDVTTAAQIQELMRTLQENLNMAIMYITHDLGVIAEMAEEVVVMYLGRVMEQTDVVSLFYEPQHPYTQGLLNSIPRLGSKNRLVPIRGVVPEPYAIPKGCVFGPRCPKFMPGVCDQAEPPLVATGTQHKVRCYLYT
jgi:oligopeptide/dipeptide ABC transporter ATP-binding protein